MPLYEYECSDCQTEFESLRTMSRADAPIACPRCGSVSTHRKISLFSAVGSKGIIAGAKNSCSSCTSGTCSTCGQA